MFKLRRNYDAKKQIKDNLLVVDFMKPVTDRKVKEIERIEGVDHVKRYGENGKYTLHVFKGNLFDMKKVERLVVEVVESET